MASEKDNSTTETTTEPATEPAQDEVDVLTAEEEKAVRMRRGLSKDDDEELEFAPGADEEARARMARLEEFLVEAYQDREAGASYFSEAESDDERSQVKEKIIQRLKESGD
ncbi:MAG: hypothetical protein ABEL76_00670 [Bradymonadaceae bacterium]